MIQFGILLTDSDCLEGLSMINHATFLPTFMTFTSNRFPIGPQNHMFAEFVFSLPFTVSAVAKVG